MKLLILISGLFISLAATASLQVEPVLGSNAKPSLTEEYLSYNFGMVFVNSRVSVRYNVRNTGTTPLTFKDAVIWGADFSADHSCGKGLQPNETCQFEVAYWPMFEGMSSGRFLLEFAEDNIDLDLFGNAHR